MAIERVTYFPGSASILRLPDRTEVLLEIVPTAVRLRKLGALGRPGDSIWEHRFSAEVRDGSPLARRALDVALESIDGAFSVDDAVRKLSEVAGPKLEALGGPQKPDDDEGGTPTIDPVELSRYQSAHPRARWVVALLAATIVIDVVAVGSGLAEVGLVSRAMNGAFITEAEATANDARQGLIGIVQMLLFVGTVVAFLVWLHRSHRNLQALHARYLRFSPGWAVGYFFIPILNLFRPYQAVKETWKASDPTALQPTAWQGSRGSSVLRWWWAFWLIMNWLGMAAFRLSLAAGDDLSVLRGASVVTVLADFFEIVAAAFAILVVRGIDRRQEEKFRRLSGAVHTVQP
jgi:hypothetical protein